ncbi:hypothetical protein EAG_09694 [Camponotus floridanus]|uniref:Uncharacterized protein n=1 Tax=Camponotus floridanus TaxID=104421 RepID=E2ATG4_CAMFO|nr:hypothetical protein EAG_09694 [Camponotus floridanus]
MERVLLVHAGVREMRKNANLGDRTREVFGEKCREEREAGRNGAHMEIARRSDPGKRDHPPTTVSCILQTALVRQLGELTFGTVVFRLPRNLHHVIALWICSLGWLLKRIERHSEI